MKNNVGLIRLTMTKYITHATILVSLAIVQALNHMEYNRRHLKYGLVNALKEATAGLYGENGYALQKRIEVISEVRPGG